MHPTQNLAAPTAPSQPGPRRWLLPLQIAAAAVGAWQGLGFGVEISGLALGLLLAANGALFGSLAAQTLVDVADRLADRRR
jgi:hypothetical protein